MEKGQIASIANASKLASGRLDLSVQDWLQIGFSAWVRCGGKVPLERCLRLPRTAARFEVMRRNVWIAIAAEHVSEGSSWKTAVALEEELARFLSRGPWPHWRHLDEPPAEASQLRAALFHVAKNNKGDPLSSKQIHRILGQSSSK